MSTNKALILSASAGSGKTYQLAYKYILDVIKDRPTSDGGKFFPNAYHSILAVTFTNKATEEMKTRIITQIHKLATHQTSDYLDSLVKETGLEEEEIRRRALAVRTGILHDYSHFSILTNDTFFQRILRAFIIELGMDLNLRVELDTDNIVKRSADAILEKTEDKKLQQWIMEYASERVENGEKWDIKSGILLLQKELFKEQTHEAITTIKDKEELKKTISDYKKFVTEENEKFQKQAKEIFRDIESSPYSKYFKSNQRKYLAGLAEGTIKEPTEAFLRTLESGDFLKEDAKKKKVMITIDIEMVERIRNLIRKLQDQIIPANNNKKILLNSYRSFALLKDLYDCAKEVSNDDNALILSETKHTIARLINEIEAPFIYEKVGCRFERIMIDEFQDTSLKEWKNFLPLILNAVSSAMDNVILIVGDIKQSIYRWRGGDWNILSKIAPEDIGKKTEVEKKSLDMNFRSLEKIVEFNRDFFSFVKEVDNENLNSILNRTKAVTSESFRKEHKDALEKAYADIGDTKAGKKQKEGGYINLSVYNEQPEINQRIKMLLDIGYKPCDISILVRSNHEAKDIAQMVLKLKDEEDPRYHVDIMTQEALLLNSSSMVTLLRAILRLSINREDIICRGIFLRYIHGMDFMSTLSDEENEFLDSIYSSPILKAVEQIMTKYHDVLIGETAYILSFNEQVIRYSTTHSNDIASFLDWWDDNSRKFTVTVAKDENTIEIMTIHKSKGLENRIIIIPYCNWATDVQPSIPLRKNTIWAEPNDERLKKIGPYPVEINKSLEHSAFSEGYVHEMIYSHIDAINLLYVAFTRAKEHLYVYMPKEQYEKYNKERNLSSVDALIYDWKVLKDKSEDDVSSIARYEYGEFKYYANTNESDKKDTIQISRYHNYDCSEMGMILSLRTERYYDEHSGTVSNRQIGIILHNVFQHSENVQQIEENINALERDGLLSSILSEQIKKNVSDTISKEPAQSWFSGEWDQTLTERDIICPGEKNHRPDRILIRGKRAVIIDYKFGAKDKAYHSQLRKYGTLMKKMGFSSVEKYIWYVVLNEIEKVQDFS